MTQTASNKDKQIIGSDLINMRIGSVLTYPNEITRKIDIKQLVGVWVGRDSIIIEVEDYDHPGGETKQTLSPIKLIETTVFFRNVEAAKKELKVQIKKCEINSLLCKIKSSQIELERLSNELELDKKNLNRLIELNIDIINEPVQKTETLFYKPEFRVNKSRIGDKFYVEMGEKRSVTLSSASSLNWIPIPNFQLYNTIEEALNKKTEMVNSDFRLHFDSLVINIGFNFNK